MVTKNCLSILLGVVIDWGGGDVHNDESGGIDWGSIDATSAGVENEGIDYGAEIDYGTDGGQTETIDFGSEDTSDQIKIEHGL